MAGEEARKAFRRRMAESHLQMRNLVPVLCLATAPRPTHELRAVGRSPPS
jgi:hypothetical protein